MKIKEIRNKILKKEISIEELVSSYINKAKELNPTYNSFITICEDEALEKAKEYDDKLSKMSDSEKENLPILFGIPYSAKDLYLTKGIRTTGATKMLDKFIPPYSSTVIEKLNKQGAILIGKTNCDPFGFGSSTENSDYGVSGNSYDPKVTAGGSSGGSGASVALETSVFSMGTDTGGSIRQPASFNNLVGIKPTYGRISRYGVIAYASSLDTMGHFTKTVEDNALLLNITAGFDTKDGTSSKLEADDYTKSIGENIKGLKIGVAKEFLESEMDEEVKKNYEDTIKTYEKLGAEIVQLNLKMLDYASSVYYLISTAEASSNLARYDGIRYGHSSRTGKLQEDIYFESRSEGFNDEIKRRIILGTYALSSGYYDEYYKKALKLRTLVIEDYNKAFEKVDVLLAPVFPILPFEFGKFSKDPVKMWLADLFTVTLNVFGGPGLSVPSGFSKSGLPIGIQLIGPHFSEQLLYKVGHAFEQETEFYKQLPKT